jgi:hypothetical protein
MIVWLDVPFAEKDAAKKRGALWSREQRKWFVDSPKSFDPYLRWMSRDDRRAFGPGRGIGSLCSKSLSRSFEQAIKKEE